MPAVCRIGFEPGPRVENGTTARRPGGEPVRPSASATDAAQAGQSGTARDVRPAEGRGGTGVRSTVCGSSERAAWLRSRGVHAGNSGLQPDPTAPARQVKSEAESRCKGLCPESQLCRPSSVVRSALTDTLKGPAASKHVLKQRSFKCSSCQRREEHLTVHNCRRISYL